MKKKRQRTQKQKAIRWALVFVVCLVIAQAFHIVRLTPMQTIRATEWRLGLEPTEIVLSEGDLYLSESETVLMLSKHEPRLTNIFIPPPVAIMDKSKDPSALAGGYVIFDIIGQTITLHLVGEVFLEDAHSVHAFNRYELNPALTSTELASIVFPTDNGRQYFWSVTEVPYDDLFVIPHDLDVLDQNGNVLYGCEIAWTSETIQ